MGEGNYITLALNLLIILPVATGVIVGFAKGASRSFLSLILIGVAVIASFLSCGALLEVVKDIEINGQTIRDAITTALISSELPESVVNVALNAIFSVAKTLIFILTFILGGCLLRLIIYPILKAIFIHGKKKTMVSRLVGVGLGLVCGVLTSFNIVAPITGLAEQVDKVCEIEVEGEKIIELTEEYSLKPFLSSSIGQFNLSFGKPVFKEVSSIVKEDGKKVSVSDNVEAIVVSLKIVKEVSSIKDVDLSEGLNQENVSEVKQVLENIDQIKDASTDTAKEILNEVIKDVSTSLGEEVQITLPEDFDIGQVDFSSIGDTVEVLFDYSENPTEPLNKEQVETVVNTIVENQYLIEALVGEQTLVEVDNETKQLVTEELERVEGLSEEDKAKIKLLLGIN